MSDKTKRKIADTVDYVMFKTPIFAGALGAAVIGLWTYMIKKYDC